MKIYYKIRKFFTWLQFEIFGMTEKQHDEMMALDSSLNDNYIKTNNPLKEIQIDESADFIF